MVKLKSVGELETLRKSITEKRDPKKTVITVCNGTGCHAHGCRAVTAAFQDEVKKQKLETKLDVRATGCHGFCERGPLVVIKPKDIFYQRVRVKDIPEILSETVGKGNVIERMLYTDRATNQKITYEHNVPFYKLQKRLVFGNNGLIDPTSIEDYLAVDPMEVEIGVGLIRLADPNRSGDLLGERIELALQLLFARGVCEPIGLVDLLAQIGDARLVRSARLRIQDLACVTQVHRIFAR